MWLTICSTKICQWDHVASSRTSAEVYAHWHRLAYQGHGHRMVVVEIAEPCQPKLPSTPASPAMAA
jgi:hypothetical protein